MEKGAPVLKPVSSHSHSVAKGFERSPAAYERGRPDYPADIATRLLDLLDVTPASRVLELGSGTGKFTRLARQRTRRLLATDPSPAMRKHLRTSAPELNVLGTAAEHIALTDASIDAVICAQAFHWFEGERALKEVHRVLRRGGHFGLIWNVRDENADWIGELTHIMDPYSGEAPRYRTSAWKAVFENSTQFSALRHEAYRHVVRCDRATILDRVGSISFIANLPDREHTSVLTQVGHLLSTHPETRNLEQYDFPYRSDLFWCSSL